MVGHAVNKVIHNIYIYYIVLNIFTIWKKGKTYDEIYGIEKSIQLRKKLGHKCSNENKKKFSLMYKGKTYEKRYGLIKATKIKNILSIKASESGYNCDVLDKRIKTRLGITYLEYLNILPKYNAYKNQVYRITNKQSLYLLENIEKRGRKQYHLDHIIPISYGFYNSISPEIIGNIKNLQMLWYIDNLKKYNKMEKYYANSQST